MTVYAKHFSTLQTSQSEPIPGKPMVPNSAGGFAFAVDDWTRLNRFLILGSEGGSYYASEKKLTIENATCVNRCLDSDGPRAVAAIVAVSLGGRAPKNDAAIFALAMAAGHKDAGVRLLALAALPEVCRIGTHLFQFCESVRAFRGWGPALREAVAEWYTTKSPEQLAYQLGKYQSRNGWSNRDLIRLSHPREFPNPAIEAALRWSLGGKKALGARLVRRVKDGPQEAQPDLSEYLPRFLAAVDEAKAADVPTLVRLIRDHDLPRECIPTERLNDVAIWGALLEKMPLTALVRNLGKMTSIGLLKMMGSATELAVARLGDADYIRKSRLHPMTILLEAKTYAIGHGEKGKLSWTPVSRINDALDAAFYKAFGNVDPSGKRTLLALDVSGSMSSHIDGTSLSCREAAAAFAMVTAKTESRYGIVAFTANQCGIGGMHGGGDPILTPLDISACSRLTDVARMTAALPMGGTDCSLPMRWATANDIEVDTFIVLTDSETWHGPIHPCQALQEYRRKAGIPAKMIVQAFASNGFTIADPSDGGMMDVVGLDSSAPQIMADFSAGRV